MTEFKLDLSDFEEIVVCANEAAKDIGKSVGYADEADSTWKSDESGEWADAWFSTFTANVQTVLNTLQEVTSAFAGYYNSALEDANSLATQRDNVMGAVGALATDANKIALTTGSHIPTKCSDAKTSIVTLRINAQAVMYSDAWSSLTSDSTNYFTNVGVSKAKISDDLSDLIHIAENQSDALTELSENYSTFKASVEEFEEYYSGCFDTQTIEDIINGLTLENTLIFGTGILNDVKVIYGYCKPVLAVFFPGAVAVLDGIGIALDAVYVIGESAESWVKTDGDWGDRLFATAKTAALESTKVTTKNYFKDRGLKNSAAIVNRMFWQDYKDINLIPSIWNSSVYRQEQVIEMEISQAEVQLETSQQVWDWTTDAVSFVAEANYEVETAEAEANYETSQQVCDWVETGANEVYSFFSDVYSALTYSGD